MRRIVTFVFASMHDTNPLKRSQKIRDSGRVKKAAKARLSVSYTQNILGGIFH
jgi:hypothetical protein